MLKIPVENIIQRINKETGLSVDEIKRQIDAKIKSLDGLVSEEGAAFIIASELGVQLLKQPEPNKFWKIKDLVPGLRADVSGIVERTFRVIPYTYGGQAKEMGSFILRDDSGEIRVVLWDGKAKLLKEGKLRGSVKIKGGLVKENKFGGKELHVGARSAIIITGGGQSLQAQNKKISELEAGQRVLLVADIVKLFPVRSYVVCSICGKKVIPAPEGFLCSEHKQVDPATRFLISFYLDDGTGVVRATAFGNTVQKMASLTGSEISTEMDFQEALQNVLLGRTVKVEGRVKENKNFSRIEIIVNNVDTNPNPVELSKKILEVENA